MMAARSPEPTARPNHPWTKSWLLYVALFLLTGLTVYRWGLARPQPSEPSKTHTATATIRIRDASPYAVDPQWIQQQIGSPENVRRALGQLGVALESTTSDDSLATSDRTLQVTTDEASVPGECIVSIVCSAQPAQQPAQLVNRLAESYADDYLANWEQCSQQAHAQAREASDLAERQFLQAKTELEQWSPQEPEPQALPHPTLTHLPPVDNPQWTELNEQLTALEQRLAELLIDLKPRHPLVLDTQLQIGVVSEQLSETPRWAPGQQRELPSTATQVPAPEAPMEPVGEQFAQGPETTRQLESLRGAADLASDAYLQAFRLEHQAWQDLQQQPHIELHLAQLVRLPSGPTTPPIALLLAALTVGLALASGFGMLSAGTAIQPPLTTLDQVGKALPVPIVGSVPEASPTHHSEPALRRRLLTRRALILAGLILIAASAAAIVSAWPG